MFDDDEPVKKTESLARNLEPLSIDELEEYIVNLKAEIVRAEAEIAKKKSVHEAADSVFK